MDFTVFTYRKLLNTLLSQDFSFQTFAEFIEKEEERAIILRHDVDRLPENSLKFARIQAEKGIRGTYYFRIVPESFDENIIKEIYSLGHEVGYHYEDVSLIAERQKTKVKRQKWEKMVDCERYLAELAIGSFAKNLEKLRKIVPVKSICMHGSPRNRWDNRLIWKYYDYHNFGIIGEPYLDVNFDEMYYLTDTGRRWDGNTVSMRDKGLGSRDKRLWEEGYSGWKVKPISGSMMNMTPESIDFQNKYKFNSTSEIIRAAERRDLSDKMMMTFHPQRWTNRPGPWVMELVWQNVKNTVKYFLIKVRS
jgi:hypothetical protein